MGQTISDIFYPDNPNRRDRTAELQFDLQGLKEKYEEIKPQLEATMLKIRPRLDTLLKAMGLDTPEKLQERAFASMTNEEIAKWKEIMKDINTTNIISSTINDIAQIGAAGVGLVMLGLAVLGVITWTTFGIGTLILAAVAGIGLIVAAIQGAEEREKCQKAIASFLRSRVEARQAVEQLNAVFKWANKILVQFEDFVDVGINEARAMVLIQKMKSLHEELAEDFNSWTARYTAEKLQETDTNRQSWTNEDPSIDTIIEGVVDKVIHVPSSSSSSGARTLAKRAVAAAPAQKKPSAEQEVPSVDNVKLSPPKGEVQVEGLKAALKQKGLRVELKQQMSKDQAMVILHAGGKVLAVRNGVLTQVDKSEPAEMIVKVVKTMPDSLQVRLKLKSTGNFISSIDGKETTNKNDGVWVAKIKAA